MHVLGVLVFQVRRRVLEKIYTANTYLGTRKVSVQPQTEELVPPTLSHPLVNTKFHNSGIMPYVYIAAFGNGRISYCLFDVAVFV